MADNRCVCCGEIIPEGLQVCIKCQKKADAEGHIYILNPLYGVCGKMSGGQHDHRMHREDGGRLDYKGTD